MSMYADPRVMAVEEITSERREYARRESYANGTRNELFSSLALKRALAEQGEAYSVNIIEAVIRAVLARLKVSAVTVAEDQPAEDGEPTPDTAVDTLTDVLNERVWEPNEMNLELPNGLRDALALGDNYMFVWPSASDDTEISGVDVFFESPECMRLFYDDENPRVKSYAAKVWEVGPQQERRIRCTLYFADRIERWITRPKVKGDKSEDFVPYLDPDDESTVEDGHIVPNPYGEVPVFHLRPNRRPYGQPEGWNAYGPQDAITKLLATLMSTVDYHGAPQRYALTGKRSTDEVNDLYDDELDESQAPDSHASNLRSGPGQLWFLKGVDSIGQLAPADVSAFIEPTGMYLRFASATTDTPMRYFEPTGVMPSGEAQRADISPLVEKVRAHAENFGSVIEDAAEFAMMIIGYPDVHVVVRWREPQSIDDLQGWETANEKIKAGVPVRQALLEAGYEADQVDEWLYDHDENDMKRRVELLVQLGAAVQSLGAGVALGVLTAQNVTDVIASVMPDTGNGEA